MLKNRRVLISMVAVIFIIISGIGVKHQIEKPTTREKQIAFLKEHEEEMTNYIKSQNSKIETVQYDWDSVKVGKIGNGTPQGAGKVLRIFGYVNQKEENDFSLYIEIDQEKPTKVKRVYFGSGPELDGGESE